jgi:hypothetical protein
MIKKSNVDELNVLPESHVAGKLIIHLPLIPDRSLSWVRQIINSKIPHGHFTYNCSGEINGAILCFCDCIPEHE